MINPLNVAPQWVDEDDYDVVTSATVSLSHPRLNPAGPETVLYLSVENEDDEWDDDDEVGYGYVWRFAISEEESNFGESEYGNGRATELEEAKADCWEGVIEFLRGEGYTDGEIVLAIVASSPGYRASSDPTAPYGDASIIEAFF